MKSFIESQFGYCPLIWMFHGRGVNNKINHLHERSLRIVYKNNNSSFKDLLEKDNSFTVHHRNIQSLAIVLFKIKENLFDEHRGRTEGFAGRFVNTSHFGLNSLRYFTSKVWNIVQLHIKNACNFHIF